MKKFISFLLTLVLVLSFSVAAFAATDTTTNISVGGNTQTTTPGGTAELTFTVSSDGGTFGSYVLTLQSQYDKINIVEDSVGITYYAGKAAYAQANDMSSHSFTATFNVDADAVPGTYYVALGMIECISGNNTEYTKLGSGVGTIVIEEPTCDHDDGTWTTTKETSCKEAGSAERRCTKCNALLETKVLDKLAHTPGEWTTVKEASCKEAGSEELRCTVCNELLEAKVLDKLAHTAGDWASDDDNHWHECTVCGEKFDVEAHSFNWVTDKKATATETGLKHEECKCGLKRNEGTIIPATGELDDVPQTNDITPHITFIALAIAAVLGVVTFIFRRKVVK